ncbi:MAG: DMT family transporter [Nitrososphaerota archaeon]|nr:DMT family transporter [Candidatus Bathyarchaeota archaeon]MDW8061248.1 DMT family transporter [Nitrososphaerota archaeon]
MKDRRYRNLALFILMTLTWGLNWPIMKLGLRYAYPLRFTADRLALASPVILAYHLIRDKRGYLALKSAIGNLIVYSLVVSLQFASSGLGLKYQGGGLSSVLTYTQPMIVFMLAVVFLKEKLLLSRFIGTSIGFLGVAVLLGGDDTFTVSSASLLLLFGAFLWAVSTVYYKLKLELIDPLIANFIQASISSIILYIVSLPIEPQPVIDIEYLAILLYSGPVAVGVGATIWLTLLGRMDASMLSSSSLIVPLIAVVSSHLMLGEEVNLKTIIGSTLILGGVYLVNYSHGISKRLHSIIEEKVSYREIRSDRS